MNTNHALQSGFRSLILVALTAFAAACGAAPDGQTSVDEQSPTEAPTGASDPDAGTPAPGQAASPHDLPSLPGDYVQVPDPGGPSGASGGWSQPQKPGPHTRS